MPRASKWILSFVVAIFGVALFASHDAAAAGPCVVVDSIQKASYYRDCDDADNKIEMTWDDDAKAYIYRSNQTVYRYERGSTQVLLSETNIADGQQNSRTIAVAVRDSEAGGSVSPDAAAREKTITDIVEVFCPTPTSGGRLDDNIETCRETRQAVQECSSHIDRLVAASGGQRLTDDTQLIGCLSRGLRVDEWIVRERLADIRVEVPATETGEESGMTCSIEGVGWIVCPAMIFMSNIFDGALNFISTQFLQVEPDFISGAEEYWSTFVDIANVLFIVLFLVVVFSQVSGIGISNYGIKRILPRLIISAILINASFIICQILIDLSNVVGFAINDLFKGLMGETTSVSDGSTIHRASGAQTITLAVLGGAAVGVAVYLALPILGTALVAGLVAIVSVVLILVARKALILLLVVISPLAFLALVLPNTEKLFGKWRSLMTSLLLLFPIIGLLFGGASVAAEVIQRSYEDSLGQIIALIVMSVPLFATYPLLKGALNSTGKIGASITNAGNKLQGAAKNRAENSRIGEAQRHFKNVRMERRARRRAGQNFLAEQSRKGGVGGRIAGVLDTPGRLRRELDRSKAGRALGLDLGSYAASEAVDKEAAADAARKLKYEYNNDFSQALASGDANVQALATSQLSEKGEYGQRVMANYLDSGGQITSLEMADSLTRMKGVHAGLGEVGTAALKHFQSGNTAPFGVTQSELVKRTQVGLNKLGNEALAKQSAQALIAAGPDAIGVEKANEMLRDPRLRNSMSAEARQVFNNIAQGLPPNTTFSTKSAMPSNNTTPVSDFDAQHMEDIMSQYNITTSTRPGTEQSLSPDVSVQIQRPNPGRTDMPSRKPPNAPSPTPPDPGPAAPGSPPSNNPSPPNSPPTTPQGGGSTPANNPPAEPASRQPQSPPDQPQQTQQSQGDPSPRFTDDLGWQRPTGMSDDQAEQMRDRFNR